MHKKYSKEFYNKLIQISNYPVSFTLLKLFLLNCPCETKRLTRRVLEPMLNKNPSNIKGRVTGYVTKYMSSV